MTNIIKISREETFAHSELINYTALNCPLFLDHDDWEPLHWYLPEKKHKSDFPLV